MLIPEAPTLVVVIMFVLVFQVAVKPPSFPPSSASHLAVVNPYLINVRVHFEAPLPLVPNISTITNLVAGVAVAVLISAVPPLLNLPANSQ